MALTYTRRKLSSSDREKLYDLCRGANEFPTCNIPGCGGLIVTGQDWVESHFPIPHAIDGNNVVGVAHARCNKFYAEQVEVPMIAKVKRIRRKHIGAHVSRFPMQGGRHDTRKRKIGGGVVAREARTPKLTMADFELLLAATNVDMVQS